MLRPRQVFFDHFLGKHLVQYRSSQASCNPKSNTGTHTDPDIVIEKARNRTKEQYPRQAADAARYDGKHHLNDLDQHEDQCTDHSEAVHKLLHGLHRLENAALIAQDCQYSTEDQTNPGCNIDGSLPGVFLF